MSANPERRWLATLARGAWHHPWLAAGSIVAGATIVGAIVVFAGAIPVRASGGHWAITTALLDFAKTRAVAADARGITPPPLDDDVLIVRGAAHYETGCRLCHGGPGGEMPAVPAAMTPPPPDLATTLRRWTPGELFSIVKHGIKFTGMPAWPFPERDDEVWAMVAYLRRLPDLTDTEHQRLVDGKGAPSDSRFVDGSDAEAAEETGRTPALVRQVCARCHGADGIGRYRNAFPLLAGQRSGYLTEALSSFASGGRKSGMMRPIAVHLSAEARLELADYFASQPPPRRSAGADDDAVRRGASIAARGVPERDIPACSACHGPTDEELNPTYPKLAGQSGRYLAEQLALFQSRRRGGSINLPLMEVFVDRLQADDIRDVTAYYASLR